jgi:hypothetical protein
MYQMKTRTWLNLIVVFLLLSLSSGALVTAASPALATEVISVIRQDCSGYSNCYTSLSAWQTAYGGLPDGDLVSRDQIAVARIEGTWTQADTTPLTLNGWTTDADHYIKIYTVGAARHNGTPGSGYRLQTTGSGPFSSNVAYFRIEGLEIQALSNNSPAYARLSAGIDGEMHFSHNLIHGNGSNSGSGIYLYDYDGVAKI